MKALIYIIFSILTRIIYMFNKLEHDFIVVSWIFLVLSVIEILSSLDKKE